MHPKPGNLLEGKAKDIYQMFIIINIDKIELYISTSLYK